MGSVRRNLTKQGNSWCLIIPGMWRELLGWKEDQALIVTFDGSTLRLNKPGVIQEQEPMVVEEAPKRSRRKSRAKTLMEAYLKHCAEDMGSIRVTGGLPSSENIKKLVQQADRREKGRDWDAYFARVADSQWLTGQKSSFKADLPWLLTPKATAAVDCGRYDNREKRSLTVAESDFDGF